MDKQYFIERLKEAAEEGWEKALATFEDDVAEGFINDGGESNGYQRRDY